MEYFDILYSVDNRYIDIMLSSIYSLLCNGKLENLRIHIITSNFSKEDYQKLELFFKLYPSVEYYCYPLENFEINKYSIPTWRGSQIANSRLFFQEILKSKVDDINNLLYLDCDTIIVDDLSDIKNYNNGLFAVKEAGLKQYCKSLNNLDTYYNSGVIYIDVNEWLTNGYQDKIIQTSERKDIKLSFPDQDIFNCALSKYITSIPAKYNLPPHAYIFNGKFGRLYFNEQKRCVSYNEIAQSIKDTKIIHSYGLSNIKPWDSTINPFHDEYMKYILTVNPDFKAQQLDNAKKLITLVPTLYYGVMLSRTYLPENIEKHVKKIALHLQHNPKKKCT